MGAEIGTPPARCRARGPVGVEQLTFVRWCGTGQIRPGYSSRHTPARSRRRARPRPPAAPDRYPDQPDVRSRNTG
jgi:hypothetical protein